MSLVMSGMGPTLRPPGPAHHRCPIYRFPALRRLSDRAWVAIVRRTLRRQFHTSFNQCAGRRHVGGRSGVRVGEREMLIGGNAVPLVRVAVCDDGSIPMAGVIATLRNRRAVELVE